MSDHGEKTCPLCAEEMDLTDQQLKPCKCGYQICVWCWHHIVDMAEKDQIEGRCPACRTPYDKEKIVGMTVNCDSLASAEGNMERKKTQKSKSKPSEGRKQLTSVRVIQRNLVYIVGLPLNLADEDLLHHKEYFGQYGKVLKVSMSRTASGVIQQFPNNTCSVYITYAKEEEAVRCIQAVHGFTLDGKPLKACFGTTKYCHAWLRNVACINPDCLYLHEVGSQEDSFTKDEIISAYTRSRVQQITGTTNILQHRSGSMLPPPLDAYCSDSSSAKPIVKVPSSNAASVPRYSPPSGSGSSSRSTALPAAASWGTHIANQQSLATSVTSNGSSDIQRSTSVNGTLPFSAVVANAAHGPVSSSNTLKRPSRKEESQVVVDKSKPTVMKHLQHNIGVDSGSKRTTSPDRDFNSNRLSSSIDSSHNGRDIDKPSATMNSFDDFNEAVEDNPTVSNLSVGVSGMGIATNSRDERPDIPMAIGSPCDQGSIRQPGHEVSKLPHLEQSINTDTKAIPSENRVPCTTPEWDWRSDLQSQMQVGSKLKVEDISSFDSQRHHPEEEIIRSRFLSDSSSSILDANHLSSRSSLPCEFSGVNESDSRFSLDLRMNLPNGFGEKSMSNAVHSLFANEGSHKVRNADDDIVSNILSLDFDPWDDSLTSPNNLAELLGEVDQRSSTLKPSNFLKQHNSQSRFSFARYEETNNQAFDNENHSIYGQVSRDQPIQESVVSQDIYRDNLGSLNGFASNYSGGLENFAASPLFSSYKTPVSRPQVSAPPGFSAPSRLPPPGFSSHERMGLSSDTAPGTRFLDSASLLRNAYQVPPPVGNPSGVSDIEFADPAILAVGRGMINADLDKKRSGFSSQMNSFENEIGLRMLRQQSLSASQQQVNGFHNDVRNLSPSLSDPYGFSSRLMDHQTQGSSISPFSQLPRQQPSANSVLSNGHWDKWNEGQSVNSLGMAELLRNERLGFNGSIYNNGYEEPKFRIPSPGDVYNRTYGM
ncbi:hypothetical protein EUTSA_v10012567mg [Eutrema salsugineum]|uniref:RING-type domain-containing protein n=1 Tax=Eutrema salsugineum TaxID=72664 RepID=V4LF17_EUTSA|nr:uncharacterized protein LOC18018474 isoform X1 [Eutrema salsugineum]XP_024011498.1 uncharacterized protein LOC18018471 isoform X1 [Eutrema salsugineum]ESQ42329.1 hypothetical protein EUTSA_v10012567mg [Eutrema salsugineum]